MSGRWSVYLDAPGTAARIWRAEPNGPCEPGCPCGDFPTWREAMDHADRKTRWPDPGIGEAMTTLRALTTSDAEVATAVMNAARLVAAGATDRQVLAFVKIVARGWITHQDLAVLASTGVKLAPTREGARR